MDTSKAITEPFHRYHKFHENLNIKVKIIAASLNHTINHLTLPGNEGEIENLIKSADPSWKYSPVLSLKAFSREVIFNYVSEISIISSFSAFDDCTTGITAEVSRWRSFNNDTEINSTNNDDSTDEKVEKIYSRFSWTTNEVADYIPIFNYFQSIRNCIAHRSALSSKELERISNSEILIRTVCKYFPKGKALPTFTEGDLVLIDPKATILCSHVLRLICQDMNMKLVNDLGNKGLLYMACHHAFFKNVPERTQARNRTELVLRSILTQRYRITFDTKNEPVILAKELGVWKRCIARYGHFYSTGNI